jgi:hypothetical protein
MMRIKNFRSFRLNEGINEGALQEIKDDVEFRLKDLGASVKIEISDNSSQYKDITFGLINIDFVIKNIVSAQLADIINSVRWIVGYSDSIGYDVGLYTPNYMGFGKNIGFFIYNCSHLMATDGLSNLDIIEEQLSSFYEDLIKEDDELAARYFLKISLKERN